MTSVKDVHTEFEKRTQKKKEVVLEKPKVRRMVAVERLLVGKEVLRAKVTNDEVKLFLGSHVVLKITKSSSPQHGNLVFSWNALDTMTTEDDFKQ